MNMKEYDTKAVSTKSSPIDNALDGQEKAVAELGEKARQLEQRLMKVCRPTACQPDIKPEKAPMPNRSHVVERMEARTAEIYEISSRLRGIMDVLDT